MFTFAHIYTNINCSGCKMFFFFLYAHSTSVIPSRAYHLHRTHAYTKCTYVHMRMHTRIYINPPHTFFQYIRMYNQLTKIDCFAKKKWCVRAPFHARVARISRRWQLCLPFYARAKCVTFYQIIVRESSRVTNRISNACKKKRSIRNDLDTYTYTSQFANNFAVVRHMLSPIYRAFRTHTRTHRQAFAKKCVHAPCESEF